MLQGWQFANHRGKGLVIDGRQASHIQVVKFVATTPDGEYGILSDPGQGIGQDNVVPSQEMLYEVS